MFFVSIEKKILSILIIYFELNALKINITKKKILTKNQNIKKFTTLIKNLKNVDTYRRYQEQISKTS